MQNDTPTHIHLRCGSDIKVALEEAGFRGRFLEYSNPVCVGPLSEVWTPDTLEARARWIAQAWDLSVSACLEKARKEQAALESLTEKDSVTLWFEHDPYDQLILAYLLNWFSQMPAKPNLTAIIIDRHPEVADFRGLGQLSPAQLVRLWHTRKPVTGPQFALGRQVWPALANGDMATLSSVAAGGTPALPMMARALVRYLAEIPHQSTGLSLTEALALMLVDEAETLSGAALFRQLTLEADPLPYLGDLMFQTPLRHLLSAPHPCVEIARDGPDWATRHYGLTPYGRALLAQEVKFPASTPWRFDPRSLTAVQE